MNAKSLRTGVAAAMGGAVLMAGLLVGASLALADDTEQQDTTTEQARGECDGFIKDRIHRMAGGLDDLAGELGISLEEIRDQLGEGATLEEIAEDLGVDLDAAFAKLRDASLAEIDERVAAGELTQEQGDAIKDRIESFEPGDRAFGPRLDRGMLNFRGFLGDLEFDRDELHDLLEAGMAMDEALEDLGVDVDTLVEEAIANANAHIDELVADGRISQEQADEMKERLESFEIGEGLRFGPRGNERGQRGHGFFGDRDVDAAGALLDV